MITKIKKDLHIPFPWEERRHVFLERFFYIPKKYDSKQCAELIDWTSPNVFGNNAPVCVEFCSGNGQWILEQAKTQPEKNWVAVEMRFDRARQIWRKSYGEELSNLYVVCAEASEFLRYYVPPNCIAQSFINFPDPWPKRLHAKHRVIQEPFVSALKRALRPNASVTLATDSAPYRDQMLEEFSKWLSDFKEPFYCTHFPSYGDSFFADLWMEKGREIFYLQYRNAMD
jgi:tRNA (guanine-N7-)-methyltransferase